jgi:hypothetical protein
MSFGGIGLGIGVIGLGNPPLLAQNCNGFSYLQTPSGECVDLSHLSKAPPEPLETQLYRSLNQAGVNIVHQPCQQEKDVTTYGLYYPKLNTLKICNNIPPQDHKQFLDTLTHESWHVVQRCALAVSLRPRNNPPRANSTGNTPRSSNRTPPDTLFPIISGKSAIRPLIQSLGINRIEDIKARLSSEDLTDIQILYPPEDYPSEAEARFLQNHPTIVLQALSLCPKPRSSVNLWNRSP